MIDHVLGQLSPSKSIGGFNVYGLAGRLAVIGVRFPRSRGSRGGSLRFRVVITGPAAAVAEAALFRSPPSSGSGTSRFPLRNTGTVFKASLGKLGSTTCLRSNDDLMDELRLSRSRVLLGMRTEALPFRRYDGIADLGFGPRGGESPDPMAQGANYGGLEDGMGWDGMGVGVCDTRLNIVSIRTD